MQHLQPIASLVLDASWMHISVMLQCTEHLHVPAGSVCLKKPLSQQC